MKRIIFTATALILVFALCACNGEKTQTPPANTVDGSSAAAATETPSPDSAGWFGYFGALTRRESNQYNNATMQVKGLDDSVALFEIDMMEGSESEDRSSSLQIAGTMFVEANGVGVYECLKDDGSAAYTIRFERSEDGQLITVTHTGDIPLNPDGEYDWIDFRIKSDAGLAVALLENLPTAATSLNSNLGSYTINYPEESVLNYFYPVTVTFNDTGAALAEFLVCADLSAVWRLDTEDGVPALIYGSAQDMLDMVVYPESEDDSGDDGAILDLAATPLLNVILEGGALMEPGGNAKIKLDSPYPFACSLDQPLSVNDEVATVSEDGTVTAHSPGTTTIMAKIVVEGSARGFMLEITVGTEGGAGKVTLEAATEVEPEIEGGVG